MQLFSRLLCACLLIPFVMVRPVEAHPHVWVTVKTEIVMDGTRIKEVRHHWTFDDAFSAFASQGLDDNDDGVLSREELQPLAQVNVESLEEYDYFSDLYEVGAPDTGEAAFGDPKDYWLTMDGDYLTLHFTLPVLANVDTAKQTVLDIYDPSFFVDFTFADASPATLVGAASGCSMNVERPKGMDDATVNALAAIGADQREIPDDLMKMTVTMANQVFLQCN